MTDADNARTDEHIKQATTGRELSPKDVLADLFDSVDFTEAVNESPWDAKRAATLVLQRLIDAGFEVRSAWPVTNGERS